MAVLERDSTEEAVHKQKDDHQQLMPRRQDGPSHFGTTERHREDGPEASLSNWRSLRYHGGDYQGRTRRGEDCHLYPRLRLSYLTKNKVRLLKMVATE